MHMGIFDRYHMTQFLGSVLLTVSLSLPWASPAGATIFWDDEMEPGTGGYSSYPGSFDSNVKISGTASVRYDYGSECLIVGDTNPCGGFVDRGFPPTTNKWTRFYMRLSPGFQVHTVQTKMMRSDTNGIVSMWWGFLWAAPQWTVQTQQVPPGQTQNVYTGFYFNTGQWYCVEMHEQLNTPGVANGILESWVDGQQVLSRSDIMYRAAGDNSLFVNNRLFRQGGMGSIWKDRVAVGDQRIGCSSSTPKGDTTPPASPTGLAVR